MEDGTPRSPSVTKGRRGKKMGANEIDQYIGSKIRLRRTMLGISQQKLGELLSLTFQQVQKYERGSSRVGGSRLFRLPSVGSAYFLLLRRHAAEGAARDACPQT